MMYRQSRILWLLAASLLTGFQQARGQRIGRREADSLIASLRKSGGDRDELYALLRLADFNIAKEGEQKADLDSAAAYIDRAKRLNSRFGSAEGEGYITLMDAYLCKERGQKAEGRRLGEKAVAQLSNGNDPALLGKAYIALSEGYDYRVSSERQSGIDCLEKALSCYERSGKLERQGYCLERLTDLYMNNGERIKGLELGKRAVEKYKAAHYPNLEGPYVLLSAIYLRNQNHQQAVHYGLMALESAADAKDSTMQLCQINYSVGNIYFALHDYDRSLRYLRQALQVAFEHHDTLQTYVVAFGLVSVLNMNNEPANSIRFLDSLERFYTVPKNDTGLWRNIISGRMSSYEGLHEFGMAKLYCDSLLHSMQYPLTDNRDAYFNYVTVMKFYLASGQYGRARDSLPTFRRLLKNSGIGSGKRYDYQMAFWIDTAQHDYKSAVSNLLGYYAIKDSLFNEQKSLQIQEYQVAYETSEKEKNIVLLQKEGELAKKDLVHTRETRNLSVAGIGLALLLMGVGYSRYRLKQRKNRELEIKQREISDKNMQLEKLLHENEWLLREVHHRVKNNLQVVMSLLNSQSAYLQDEQALNAVMESRHRVQAMSLIHQKLYKSSNVSVIQMQEYIGELADYLRDSFNAGRRVRLELQLEAISLDVLQAVPVGLILNEVITNAFKYAFPHSAEDTITIRLSRLGGGETVLFVADNGKGFATGYDPAVNDSFGMLLIHGLVEDLDGCVEIDSSHGTAYCIRFREVVPQQNDGTTVMGTENGTFSMLEL